jgi:hypothetical protein
MKSHILALHGLKWNPFANDVPHEALWTPEPVAEALRQKDPPLLSETDPSS